MYAKIKIVLLSPRKTCVCHQIFCKAHINWFPLPHHHHLAKHICNTEAHVYTLVQKKWDDPTLVCHMKMPHLLVSFNLEVSLLCEFNLATFTVITDIIWTISASLHWVSTFRLSLFFPLLYWLLFCSPMPSFHQFSIFYFYSFKDYIK